MPGKVKKMHYLWQQLHETYREQSMKVYFSFVDFKNVFDKLPRDVMLHQQRARKKWYTM